MDKLRPFLAGLKKYHFWVLCLLILISSTVVWMMAVGNINADAAQNLQLIQTTMNDAKQIQGISQHPNDQIVAAYKQQTADLKQQVLKVWGELYKKQRDTVLKWPAALGEKFIEHVDKAPFAGEIPVDFRDLYQNYVKTRWAELPGIIKAKPITVEATAGGRNPTVKTTRKAIPDYIVEWDDQERIRKQLFSTLRPTNDWVWTTQEDLWIYENLLNIIKKTNAGSIGPHNAAISSIKSMDVGKTAASEAGGKSQRIATGSADPAAATGETGGGGEAAGSGLYAGRYVDAAGLPVEGGQAPVSDEYRRIPIRLVMRMDARDVPQLILSCANAPLPVEVQQVRINADGSAGTKGEVKAPELSNEDRTAGRKTPHVEVSMQGVVYIFNPPNRTKLKLEDEEAAAPAGESFTAEEGATETPAFTEEGTTPPADPATATPMDPATTPADPATTVPADPTTPPTDATETAPMDPVTVPEGTGLAPESTEPAAETTPAATPAAPAGEAPKAGVEALFEE